MKKRRYVFKKVTIFRFGIRMPLYLKSEQNILPLALPTVDCIKKRHIIRRAHLKGRNVYKYVIRKEKIREKESKFLK